MNSDEAYRIALELASTARYNEAEKKLDLILEEHPGNLDALILLAKVKYYLRRYSASKAVFETALLYGPENTTAYFGLQFFRERRRSIRNGALSVVAMLFLISFGIVIYLSLEHSSMTLSNVENGLQREVARLELLVEENDASILHAEESSADLILDMATRLEGNADILTAVERNTRDQIESVRTAITLIDGIQTSQYALIERLFDEIRDLRTEYDRIATDLGSEPMDPDSYVE